MPSPPPPTHDLRVSSTKPLMTPEDIQQRLPANNQMLELIESSRRDIVNIITGRDKRTLMIVGPCSVHDVNATREYAARLAKLTKQYEDRLLIMIRLCGEKPRTNVGWKGFLSDPRLDSSHEIETALQSYRAMLIETLRLGLPVACEMLNPTLPPYSADLISLAWIGARTSESQPIREMASGLSMPVGFKHAGNGDVNTAINAMMAARGRHTFVGIDRQGRTAVVNTTGNTDTFLIMRGGNNGPNYDTTNVTETSAALATKKLNHRLLIDCSHGNCAGDYRQQESVFREVVDRIAGGEQNICGLMLESYTKEGSQPFPKNPKSVDPHLSITDACINIEKTEELLEYAYSRLVPAR